MTEQLRSFGRIAAELARNPLGIIALFIVLVYGFACLTTAYGTTLTPAERTPLIYFLIIFPVVVLLVFVYLVICHPGKLYGPGDFKDESNFMEATGLLAAASAKRPNPPTADAIVRVVDSARVAGSTRWEAAEWKTHVLWVDDRPANNEYERRAFEAVGLRFTLAESTNEALEKLRRNQYAAIISDMGRREGPREGYVLLDTLRNEDDQTPFFFYASSNAPEHKQEALAHGGQGCTNSPQELFEMVTRTVNAEQNT